MMPSLWQAPPAGTSLADPSRPGTDPLLLLAEATGYQDFLRSGDPIPELLPMLCELTKPNAIAKLAAELASTAGGWLTPAYPRVPGQATAFCTGLFTPAFLAAVHAGRLGRMIRRLELQMPVIPHRPRVFQPCSPQPPTGLPPVRPKAGVDLIGVIDSGCPFAHAGLRTAGGGTRLLALWDQDEEARFGGSVSRPVDFGYGAEVHRHTLDNWMSLNARHGSVDEDGCYALAGLPGLRRRMSHGGAVLDLLAGSRRLEDRVHATDERPPTWQLADDAASRADIVFVDLPRNSVQDSSSGGLGRWLLDGLRYICSCAGPRTKRIVVNISNGTSRSTHDGTSLLERAMLDLIEEQKRHGRVLHIVVAAGNARDEETHAQLDGLRVGVPAKIHVQVPPASEAPAWITIRVPPGRAADLTFTLLPPRGACLSPVAVAGTQLSLVEGQAHLAAIVFPEPLDRSESSMVLVYIAATERWGTGACAPHGDWTLYVEAHSDSIEPLHLFLSRNQTNPGALPRGRQARFVSDYEGYSPDRWRRSPEVDPHPPCSPIRRTGTLNGLATAGSGTGLVVAGSVYWRANGSARFSPYSALGPSAGPYGRPSRCDVDDRAPTDMYRGLSGIRAAGNRSGIIVRVNGTSFAAPQVARRLLP